MAFQRRFPRVVEKTSTFLLPLLVFLMVPKTAIAHPRRPVAEEEDNGVQLLQQYAQEQPAGDDLAIIVNLGFTY
jgi:hypothetical protein